MQAIVSGLIVISEAVGSPSSDTLATLWRHSDVMGLWAVLCPPPGLVADSVLGSAFRPRSSLLSLHEHCAEDSPEAIVFVTRALRISSLTFCLDICSLLKAGAGEYDLCDCVRRLCRGDSKLQSQRRPDRVSMDCRLQHSWEHRAGEQTS